MAAAKRTAADLGAYICFEDEAGQGLRPPKGRTWAPRGARPVVRVRGRGNGRVNIAGTVCFRPGSRPHFFYRLHVYHGRKGGQKTFAWHEYRDWEIENGFAELKNRLRGAAFILRSKAPELVCQEIYALLTV